MDKNAYEYTIFPRKFVTYKWYKPLVVGAITAVVTFLFQLVIMGIARLWLGSFDLIREAGQRSSEYFYSGPGTLITVGGVAAALPSLAIAAHIVGDRPFSSYSSSRGGWNWSAFAKSLVLAVAVFGVASVGEALLLPDPAADHVNRFSVVGLLVCLVAVFVQATAEEYLFRGLLMQAIGSWTRLPIVAILLSSLVFAVSHSYGLLGITAVLVHGLGFAFLAWYSRGLESGSCAHIVNNMSVFLCSGLGLASSQEGGLAALILTSVTMIVYCLATVLLDKRYGWFTSQGDGVAAFNEQHRVKAISRPSSRKTAGRKARTSSTQTGARHKRSK